MIPEFLLQKGHTIESIPQMVENIKDAFLSLSDYCQFWWQVQLSAQLGGGLWEQIAELRDFVLLHDYDDYKMSNYVFVERTASLEPILYTTNTTSSSSNADEVMFYLLDNHAIYRKLLLEDYRSRGVDKMKKHLFLGISSTPSPIKEKTPSPIPLPPTKEKTPPKPSPGRMVSRKRKRSPSLTSSSSSPISQKRKRIISPKKDSTRKTKNTKSRNRKSISQTKSNTTK
jgi:hypothetical protein